MDGLIFLKDQHTPNVDMSMTMTKLGYNDTTLFNMIQKATTDKKSKAIDGHSWWYENAVDGDDDNAHQEGSAPAGATFGELGSSKNHYQIIKHTYGITGSMEDKQDIEGSDEFKKEGVRKTVQHRKTIEKLLFSGQAPVQRGGVDANGDPIVGRAGGLKHWLTATNTLDNAGDLTIKLFRELFKLGFYNGMPTSHLFMNDAQKDRLDDLFADKMRGTYGQTTLKDTNYSTLENFSYAPKVKVILTPYVAQDEIIGTNASSLALVYQRLTKSSDIPTGDDKFEKQLISELTLRVNNPYGVVGMTGLTV